LHEQFFGEPPKRKLKRTDDDEDIAYHIERLLVRISESYKRTGKVLPHRVIVIDEVDCFSHYEKAFTLLVKHILKPTAGVTRTSIIGIANSVDLPFRKKHSAIAMRDTQLLFEPYGVEDIESIVQEKKNEHFYECVHGPECI